MGMECFVCNFKNIYFTFEPLHLKSQSTYNKNLGVISAKIKIAKIAKSAQTAKIKLRENISMYSI